MLLKIFKCLAQGAYKDPCMILRRSSKKTWGSWRIILKSWRSPFRGSLQDPYKILKEPWKILWRSSKVLSGSKIFCRSLQVFEDLWKIIEDPQRSCKDFHQGLFLRRLLPCIKANSRCTYHECWVSARLLPLERSRRIFEQLCRKKDWITHRMILQVHKETTDKLIMGDIGNQFVSASNDRQNRYGKFGVN